MRPTVIGFLLAASLPPWSAGPIQVLILDGESGGPYHAWQQTTPYLHRMLDDAGIFQVDVVTAPPKGGDYSSLPSRLGQVPGSGLELRRARRALARQPESFLRTIRPQRRRLRLGPRFR